MISLLKILNEHHHKTSSERLGDYAKRIQKIKDKLADMKDKNTDTAKLYKGKIKVIQQTIANFKQNQAIKKQKSA